MTEWIFLPREFISDSKHRQAIGKAIFLYLYYLDCLADDRTYSDVAASERLGTPLSTIRHWRHGLEDSGYMPKVQIVSYVYLIHASNDLYKIGVALDPQARLETLQTGSPLPLDLTIAVHAQDAYGLEAWLHRYFAGARQHGEWFALSLEDVQYIKSLAE